MSRLRWIPGVCCVDHQPHRVAAAIAFASQPLCAAVSLLVPRGWSPFPTLLPPRLCVYLTLSGLVYLATALWLSRRPRPAGSVLGGCGRRSGEG